jgi:hypothetical protein
VKLKGGGFVAEAAPFALAILEGVAR